MRQVKGTNKGCQATQRLAIVITLCVKGAMPLPPKSQEPRIMRRGCPGVAESKEQCSCPHRETMVRYIREKTEPELALLPMVITNVMG